MNVEKNDFIIDFSDPEQKQNYINFINSLESQYKIQHERFNKYITTEQRNYYWVCIKYLSDHTGHSQRECHIIMKWMFNIDSIVTKSTHEMTLYIESIKLFALEELNIRIPNSNEIIYNTNFISYD